MGEGKLLLMPPPQHPYPNNTTLTPPPQQHRIDAPHLNNPHLVPHRPTLCGATAPSMGPGRQGDEGGDKQGVRLGRGGVILPPHSCSSPIPKPHYLDGAVCNPLATLFALSTPVPCPFSPLVKMYNKLIPYFNHVLVLNINTIVFSPKQEVKCEPRN